MSLQNIKAKKDHGFTIVELLVVIVVIGILASITIVSYTGITARANAAATKQLASNVISRVGLYQTEGPTLNWPLTGALAMGTYTNNSAAAITGISVVNGAAVTTASLTTISYQVCGSTMTTGGTVGTPSAAPSPANATTVTNPTGIIVGYWDYSAATPIQATLSAGQTSGTVISSGTNYNTIACYYTAS